LNAAPIDARHHAGDGPTVLVLHGGPGAPGSAAGLARGLAGPLNVVEPFQRRADDRPLTVARHVADLHALVQACGGDAAPSLVGSSWGAMLALAYAAQHPRSVSRIALVGSGTFDLRARARLNTLLDERLTPELHRNLAALEDTITDPDERLAAMGRLIEPVYSVDPLPSDDESEPCDARGHAETWEDMIRLQAGGTYPAAFAAYDGPVLMLHGNHDPHPGPLIRDSLLPDLPQLRYVEFPRCGHYPWREHRAREAFFGTLIPWLLER
jgi:pimeloyl-ACP methyl ester carboxylesterase